MFYKYFMIVSIIVLLLTVSACGYYERVVAGVTNHSKICVDNVSYIQFTSGATVQYDTDGKVKLCK